MGSEKSHDVFGSVSMDLLERSHTVRFRAPGWSMHPTIRHGEAITVVPVSFSEVGKGDIVLYRCNGNVFAHRVVAVNEQEESGLLFTLQGDALGSPEEFVVNHQIVGKVVSVERGGRCLDLYSWRVQIVRKARTFVSRLRKLIRSLI